MLSAPGTRLPYLDSSNSSTVEQCESRAEGATAAAVKVPEYCQILRFKDSNGQTKELLFPKALDLDRPKRPRTTFSQRQLGILEQHFLKNQYLVGKDRTRLAAELGLSETQIKVWFQNRRTKNKRDRTTGIEIAVDTDKIQLGVDVSPMSSGSCSSPVGPDAPEDPPPKLYTSPPLLLTYAQSLYANVNPHFIMSGSQHPNAFGFGFM